MNVQNGGQKSHTFLTLQQEHDPSKIANRSYRSYVLSKTLRPGDGTYAGWTGMLQGFQKYFAWNPKILDIESPI